MTPLKKTNPVMLFDLNHNEMINIEDKDFTEFSGLLHSLGLKMNKNEVIRRTVKTIMPWIILKPWGYLPSCHFRTTFIRAVIHTRMMSREYPK